MWWVPVTLLASALQTARNATQAGLVERIGTLGATQVRFIFGLPFAILFLGIVAAFTPLPHLVPGAMGFALLGALSQIGATALMLAAMRMRSFAATTAIIKTEPVMLALFGTIVLGDHLGATSWIAVVIATAGTVLMAAKPGATGGSRAVLTGLAAGALFGLSAVGFRGAILALPDGSFIPRATLVLVISLSIQTLVLGLWLAVFDRRALAGAFRVWRSSLSAGFFGAAASQCWFLGFALTSAANVRTLALVEVVFAQIVSRRVFSQGATVRELTGMALIVLGVAMLLMAAG